MPNESTTVVLGIPIPSTDPVFLAIIGVHVLFGPATVITGAVAMLSKKRGSGRHSNFGTIYFFGVCSACCCVTTARGAHVVRACWAGNYHLFILGALAFASALFGRNAVQRRWHQWPRPHPHGRVVLYSQR